MEKTKQLDLMLFVVRMTVGVAFVIHGGRRILQTIAHMGLHGFCAWTSCHYLFSLSASLMPLVELVGGGLILTGALIEIGALLVIPASLIAFFVTSFSNPAFISPTRPQYILNLAILTIAIGICGPGKWALWDPGKYWRKKIFEPDQMS